MMSQALNQAEGRRILSKAPSTLQLSGFTFDGLDLHSVTVRRQVFVRDCSFGGTDLRFATLEGVHFSRCNFRGVLLASASLRAASFAGCDLREADLRDTDLTTAEFSYILTGLDSGRTDTTGIRLDGAILTDLRCERVIGWPDASP